jgi:hypothetical protein
VANGVAAWADDKTVAEWPRLRELVTSDRRFLLWAQQLHDPKLTSLTGAGLTEAIGWYERRRDDLTRGERQLIGFSEERRRRGWPRPALGTWLRALRATPAAIAFALLMALGAGAGHLLLSHEVTFSWPQLLSSAGLVVLLGVALDGLWLRRGWRALQQLTLAISCKEPGILLREAAHQLELAGYEVTYASDTVMHLQIGRDAIPPSPAAGGRLIRDSAVYDVRLLNRAGSPEHALLAAGPRGVLDFLGRALRGAIGSVEISRRNSLIR